MKFSIVFSAAALLLVCGFSSQSQASSWQTLLQQQATASVNNLQNQVVNQAQTAAVNYATGAITSAINATGYQSYLNNLSGSLTSSLGGVFSSVTGSLPSVSRSVSVSSVMNGGCVSKYVSGAGESACGRVDLSQLRSYLAQRSTGAVTPDGILNTAYSQVKTNASIYLTGSMNSIVNQATGYATGYVSGVVNGYTSQATNYLTTQANSYVSGATSTVSGYLTF